MVLYYFEYNLNNKMINAVFCRFGVTSQSQQVKLSQMC